MVWVNVVQNAGLYAEYSALRCKSSHPLLRMSQESPLSTRLDVPCRSCGAPYRLVETTDALAARPVTVDVVCSDCGHQTAVTLVEGGRGRHPSSGFAPSPNAPRARAPGSVSGVNLTSRYSICSPDMVEDAEPASESVEAHDSPPKSCSSVA